MSCKRNSVDVELAATQSTVLIPKKDSEKQKEKFKKEGEIKPFILKKTDKNCYKDEHMLERYPKIMFCEDANDIIINKLQAKIFNLTDNKNKNTPASIISIYGGGIDNVEFKNNFDNLYMNIIECLFETFTGSCIWFLTDGISEDVASIINRTVYENMVKETELPQPVINVIGITSEENIKSNKISPNHHIYMIYETKESKQFLRSQLEIKILEKYAKDGEEMWDENYVVMVLLFISGNSDNLFHLDDFLNNYKQVKNGEYKIVLVRGLCNSLNFLCNIIQNEEDDPHETLSKDEEKFIRKVGEKIKKFENDKNKIIIFNLNKKEENLKSLINNNARRMELEILTLSEEKDKVENYVKLKLGANVSDANNYEIKENKTNMIKYSLRYDRADILECLFKMDNNCLELFPTKTEFERILSLKKRNQKMLVKFKNLQDFQKEIYTVSNYAINIFFFDESTDKKETKEAPIEICLFFWAIFRGHFKLTRLMWNRCQDPISTALVAAKFFLYLSKKQRQSPYLSKRLVIESKKYQKDAIEIIQLASISNKTLSEQLCYRQIDLWSDKSILDLSLQLEMKKFLNQTTCIEIFNNIWNDKIACNTPGWKVIFYALSGIFFAFFFLEVDDESGDEEEENIENAKEDIMVNKHDHDKENVHKEENLRILECGDNLEENDEEEESDIYEVEESEVTAEDRRMSYFKAVPILYDTPIIKLYTHVFSYIVFLCVMTYFVLIKLKISISIHDIDYSEYIVWIYCCSFIVQELDQFNFSKNSPFSYFQSFWNLFDIFLFLLFIQSVVLRFMITNEEHFIHARVTYTVLLALFFIRSLQFYFVHPSIGPDVYTVFLMWKDVAFFFIIYILFAFAYGSLKQSIMFPQSEFNWQTFMNVVYFPFWQLLSQISLEEVMKIPGNKTNHSSSNCIVGDYFCQGNFWLVYVAYAIYLVAVNVLLLNLLIAFFGATFQKVQKKSKEIYYFKGFALLDEYITKPILPPPFSIPILLFRLFLRFKFFLRSKDFNNLSSCFHKRLRRDNKGSKNNVVLKKFEQECFKNYLSRDMQSSFTYEDMKKTLIECSKKLKTFKRMSARKEIEKEKIE